jgi:uncharacterized protein (TIGR03086 family)
MLDHLMGLSLAFTWGARKSPEGSSSGPPRASAESLPPDWRAVLPRCLDELAEAWRDPAAWQGTTSVAGVSMPGEQMGVVALDEVVMHGWDLARATGQDYAPDPAALEAAHAFLRAAAAEPGRDGGEGIFGPVVPVPSDAPLLDRTVGLSGRDPGWTRKA